MSIREQIRVEQTLGEIDRLRAEFDQWRERRVKADIKKQYVTQLNALDDIVKRAFQDTHTATSAILDGTSTVGAVYESCNLQDKRILWIRRVLWGYYREKFDQRDGSDDLSKLLSAADDVIWSCYREPFEQLEAVKEMGPVPLAYIEPFYSPTALPRNEVPGILKEKRLGDTFLAQYFARLPIPLVSLPPICVAAPWWLVYLGHEVGHHVQHDLDLVEDFGDMLYKTARSAPPPTEDEKPAARWSVWGQEIFADAFSVHMMGGSAVTAMVELETHPDHDMMLSKNTEYPPPAARLALLAKIAGRLNAPLRNADRLDPSIWLQVASNDGIDQEALEALRADFLLLDKIAAGITRENLGDRGTFRGLSAWNDENLCTADGAAAEWTRALLDGGNYPKQRQLSSPRLIVSAGITAWEEIVARDEEPQPGAIAAISAEQDEAARAKRASALKNLGSRLLQQIELKRDEATREGSLTPRTQATVAKLAAEISQQLSHAEIFDW